MPVAKKTTGAPQPTEDPRAKALEHLILLNSALNNALDALEIARDNAATPAERQSARNNLPAIVQAKALLKSKTDAFIKKSVGADIEPPSQETIDKTMDLAEALAKVDATTTQVKSLLTMTGKILELVNAL